MPSLSSPSAVVRKSLLVPPLLLALYLLSDDESTSSSSSSSPSDASSTSDGPHHHLAVLTALRRHPPSLRVFRALSELTLLLFCTAASLYVWECGRIGREAVGTLLFRHAHAGANDDVDDDDGEGGDGGRSGREYEMVFTSEKEEQGKEGEEEGEAGNDANDNEGEERDGEGFADVQEDIWRDDSDGDGDGAAADPPGATSDTIQYRDHGKSQPTTAATSGGPLPPPSEAVACAALDALLVILVCLFLFTLSSAEGGRYIDGIGNGGRSEDLLSWSRIFASTANVAAPIFPLLLFGTSVLRSALPWRRRKPFWTVVSRTLMAPYTDVTFRDGFIGDILTSTVRPLQDLAFTTFYVLSGLQGWWSAEYGIDDAAGPVERSWLVHTVILPGCMVSPLWWRFLQNLRQAHDAKRRWPYLGNAFKYFIAAEVALFGVFEPDAKQNVAWVTCFFLATLYQVWWDVFMDWELLVWGRDAASDARAATAAAPKSRWWPFRLRSERMYDRKVTYYGIFVANFLLRFCWTMTFIPRRYLSRSGMLKDAYSSDFQTFVGPALASAEIIRRSLWGLLRVELEAIKLSRKRDGVVDSRGENNDCSMGTRTEGETTWDEEMEPMAIGSSAGRGGQLRDLTFSSLGPILEPYAIVVGSDMSAMSDMQILGELCLWATAFTSLGILAAAHRHVM